jgi:hypothetical protein
MTAIMDPNPPSRRDEDFPKTTTIPEGWMTETLVNGTEGQAKSADPADNTRPTPVVDDETLFTRRLDPFPKPNTIPNGWDLSGM